MISSEVAPWSSGSVAVAPADVFAGLGAAAPRLADDGSWTTAAGERIAADLSSRVLDGLHRGRAAREVLASLATPLGRRTLQVRDGLGGEVLLPDASALRAAGLAGDGDPGVQRAACSAYNEWIAGFAAADPGRFVGVGQIPATGLADAVAELAHCQQLGLRAAALAHPPAGAGTAPGGDSEEFFENAAGRTVLVLGRDFGTTPAAAAPQVAAGRAPGIGSFLVRLAFSGVPDEVEGLRIFVANAGAAWLPYVLESADTNYQRAAASRRVALARENEMPSEYVRRFTWCTLHDDRAAVLLRPYLGESHLLWSSAAPTSSTAWPGDLEAAEQLLSGLHDDAKRRLLADNCRRLFAIPGTDATVSDFTAGEIEAFTRTELFD